jgi:hypothetical protein
MFDDAMSHPPKIYPDDIVVCHPSMLETMELILDQHGVLGQTQIQLESYAPRRGFMCANKAAETWEDYDGVPA